MRAGEDRQKRNAEAGSSLLDSDHDVHQKSKRKTKHGSVEIEPENRIAHKQRMYKETEEGFTEARKNNTLKKNSG
jgi:hypothetical protein